MRSVFILLSMLAGLLVSGNILAIAADESLLGNVLIRNPAKLDNQAKKEIAAIANKLKKSRIIGAVKLIGTAKSAETPDDFFSKSVFIARSVEIYLKTLLSNRYQILITAAKYTDDNSGKQNSVEIRLYPHVLKAEKIGSVATQKAYSELPVEQNPVQPSLVDTVVQTPPESGLIAQPLAEDEQVEISSKKEMQNLESENPALANELVTKAKARAAEKARLLEEQK